MQRMQRQIPTEIDPPPAPAGGGRRRTERSRHRTLLLGGIAAVVVAVIAVTIPLLLVHHSSPEVEVTQVSLEQCRGNGGVYVGPADPEGVAQFEDWLGSPVGCAEDFLSSDKWQHISAPVWWVDHWAPDRGNHHLVLSVPLLPDSGADLASGAAGAYDQHFRDLATLLVERGLGATTLRLGWEFNAGEFPWSVQPDGGDSGNATAENFAEYWRHVVTAMREVPGADFAIDWTVNNGVNPVSAEDAYPGDDYVDIIGVDAYDKVWGEHASEVSDQAERWQLVRSAENEGLDYWAAFASEHGKAVSIPEWGVSTGDHGGGDNPYYMREMLQWMQDNGVVYDSYFNVESSRLTSGEFPEAAAVYRAYADRSDG